MAQNLIRHVTLSFGDLRDTAALCWTNRAEITVLMCEQKFYPLWFRAGAKAIRYGVNISLKHVVATDLIN